MSSLLTSNYLVGTLREVLRSRVSDWNNNWADDRQVEEEPMFEMMNQQALSVGADRRHELAAETMRDVHSSNGAARQTLGFALVSVGQRLAGEMPAPRAAAQRDADCG
jgi:hypothetical protein